MLSRERYNEILKMLEQKGSVTVSDLAKKIGVSIETVRRDLFYLESKNLLSRVHGGAILPSRMSEFLPLEARFEENAERKAECAKNAMRFLCENDIIFVDSGSTAVEFARVLGKSFDRMCVITHSLDVIGELKHKSGFKLIVLGGEYNQDEAANLGYSVTDAIKTMHAKKAIIFPVSVSLKNGVADQSAEIAAIQRAYTENADETIFVADSSKFEKNSFAKMCDTAPGQVFVTDSELGEDIYRAYRERDIKIYRNCDDTEE